MSSKEDKAAAKEAKAAAKAAAKEAKKAAKARQKQFKAWAKQLKAKEVEVIMEGVGACALPEGPEFVREAGLAPLLKLLKHKNEDVSKPAMAALAQWLDPQPNPDAEPPIPKRDPVAADGVALMLAGSAKGATWKGAEGLVRSFSSEDTAEQEAALRAFNAVAKSVAALPLNDENRAPVMRTLVELDDPLRVLVRVLQARSGPGGVGSKGPGEEDIKHHSVIEEEEAKEREAAAIAAGSRPGSASGEGKDGEGKGEEGDAAGAVVIPTPTTAGIVAAAEALAVLVCEVANPKRDPTPDGIHGGGDPAGMGVSADFGRGKGKGLLNVDPAIHDLMHLVVGAVEDTGGLATMCNLAASAVPPEDDEEHAPWAKVRECALNVCRACTWSSDARRAITVHARLSAPKGGVGALTASLRRLVREARAAVALDAEEREAAEASPPEDGAHPPCEGRRALKRIRADMVLTVDALYRLQCSDDFVDHLEKVRQEELEDAEFASDDGEGEGKGDEAASAEEADPSLTAAQLAVPATAKDALRAFVSVLRVPYHPYIAAAINSVCGALRAYTVNFRASRALVCALGALPPLVRLLAHPLTEGPVRDLAEMTIHLLAHQDELLDGGELEEIAASEAAAVRIQALGRARADRLQVQKLRAERGTASGDAGDGDGGDLESQGVVTARPGEDPALRRPVGRSEPRASEVPDLTPPRPETVHAEADARVLGGSGGGSVTEGDGAAKAHGWLRAADLVRVIYTGYADCPDEVIDEAEDDVGEGGGGAAAGKDAKGKDAKGKGKDAKGKGKDAKGKDKGKGKGGDVEPEDDTPPPPYVAEPVVHTHINGVPRDVDARDRGMRLLTSLIGDHKGANTAALVGAGALLPMLRAVRDAAATTPPDDLRDLGLQKKLGERTPSSGALLAPKWEAPARPAGMGLTDLGAITEVEEDEEEEEEEDEEGAAAGAGADGGGDGGAGDGDEADEGVDEGGGGGGGGGKDRKDDAATALTLLRTAVLACHALSVWLRRSQEAVRLFGTFGRVPVDSMLLLGVPADTLASLGLAAGGGAGLASDFPSKVAVPNPRFPAEDVRSLGVCAVRVSVCDALAAVAEAEARFRVPAPPSEDGDDAAAGGKAAKGKGKDAKGKGKDKGKGKGKGKGGEEEEEPPPPPVFKEVPTSSVGDKGAACVLRHVRLLLAALRHEAVVAEGVDLRVSLLRVTSAALASRSAVDTLVLRHLLAIRGGGDGDGDAAMSSVVASDVSVGANVLFDCEEGAPEPPADPLAADDDEDESRPKLPQKFWLWPGPNGGGGGDGNATAGEEEAKKGEDDAAGAGADDDDEGAAAKRAARAADKRAAMATCALLHSMLEPLVDTIAYRAPVAEDAEVVAATRAIREITREAHRPAIAQPAVADLAASVLLRTGALVHVIALADAPPVPVPEDLRPAAQKLAESGVEALTDDPEAQLAAAKIQSISRGKRDRARVDRIREERAIAAELAAVGEEGEEAAVRIQSIARKRRDARRVAELKQLQQIREGVEEIGEDAELAAVRIQSIARGKRDRARVRDILDEREAAAIAAKEDEEESDAYAARPLFAGPLGQADAANFRTEATWLAHYLLERGQCRTSFYVVSEEPKMAPPAEGADAGAAPTPVIGDDGKPVMVRVGQADPCEGPTRDQWVLLLDTAHDAPRYARGSAGVSPLQAAVLSGLADTVRRLIAVGAAVDEPLPGRLTPLMAALAHGYDDVAASLIAAGADVDAINDAGDNVLKYAFVSPDAAEQTAFAAFNEARISCGNTPLPLQPQYADTPGTAHAVFAAGGAMELAAAGGDVLRPSPSRRNSAWQEPPPDTLPGFARNVPALLAAGADPNVSDNAGNFPLHWAVAGTSISVQVRSVDSIVEFKGGDHSKGLVDALLAAGASANACNREGRTPLHECLMAAQPLNALTLLDADAHPNVLDKDGNLPLHLAALGLGGGSDRVEGLVSSSTLTGALSAAASPTASASASASAATLTGGTDASATSLHRAVGRAGVVAALLHGGVGKPIQVGKHVDDRKGLTREAKRRLNIEKILVAGLQDVSQPASLTQRWATRSELANRLNGAGMAPIHIAAGAGLAGLPLDEYLAAEQMDPTARTAADPSVDEGAGGGLHAFGGDADKASEALGQAGDVEARGDIVAYLASLAQGAEAGGGGGTTLSEDAVDADVRCGRHGMGLTAAHFLALTWHRAAEAARVLRAKLHQTGTGTTRRRSAWEMAAAAEAGDDVVATNAQAIDKTIKTALAWDSAYKKALEALRDCGADISAVDCQARAGGGGPRFTPLHFAVFGGGKAGTDVEVERPVHAFLDAGAPVLAATSNPPLWHLACAFGRSTQMVERLMRTASREVDDRRRAEEAARAEAERDEIAWDADPLEVAHVGDGDDDEGRRMSDAASDAGHSVATSVADQPILEEVVNARGSGIYKGHRKFAGTALQLAAERGLESTVSLLLSVPGVDVNAARPHDGRTALHLAAFRGHEHLIETLIVEGSADVSILDANNESALVSAIKGNHAGIVGGLATESLPVWDKVDVASTLTGQRPLELALDLHKRYLAHVAESRADAEARARIEGAGASGFDVLGVGDSEAEAALEASETVVELLRNMEAGAAAPHLGGPDDDGDEEGGNEEGAEGEEF